MLKNKIKSLATYFSADNKALATLIQSGESPSQRHALKFYVLFIWIFESPENLC